MGLAAGRLLVEFFTGILSFGGPGLVALGLVAGDELDRLVDRIRRFQDGDRDVTFETDRTDAVGRLYDAVGDLAGTLAERERELECRERHRERQLADRALEAAPVGVTIADATREDDPLVYANAAFEELTGYDAEAVSGRNCRFLQGPDTDPTPVAELRAAIDAAEPVSVELRNYRRDGTPFWNRVSVSPVTDETGGVTHFVGFQEDVTDRVEYARELERTTDLLEQAQRMTRVVSWELDLTGGPPYRPVFSGPVGDVLDLARDEDATMEDLIGFAHPDHRERRRAAFERAIETGNGWDHETRGVTTEGEEFWVHSICEPVVEDGDVVALRGTVQDVTERKRREEAIERTTELLSQAQEMARVGGWELDLETDELTVTDQFREIHGMASEGSVTLDEVLSYYHPEDVEEVQETLARAVEAGESYDMEVRLRTAAGVPRWVRVRGEPVVVDGEAIKLRGSMQDVTEAKERERGIRTLHDAAQALLQRETEEAVADLIVRTADDLIDDAAVALYLLDPTTNRLAPAAATAGYETATGGAPPVDVGVEGNPIWNCFATGTRRVVDAGEESAGVFGEAVGGALLVPVGDHGVLVVAIPDAGVRERTRQFVETLVATTEAAFDRIESEAAIRERDAELAERNRRLQHQIQLTNLIRRVDQSLIGATSREEIETAVTEQLAAAESVAVAWIGSVDSAGERLVPRSWAGAGEAYLDEVSLALGDPPAEPAAEAAGAGELVVVENVVADLGAAPWRKRAADSGLQSVLAVPIVFEEYQYGVLAVYAGEPDAFGDLKGTVFAELGQTIGGAINDVQTREALHADALLELTLEIEGDGLLAQVASAADCAVEYVGTATRSRDVTRLFLATDAPVADVLADLVSVSDYRLLSESGDRYVYEATVTGGVLPAKLLRHGATPESIVASPAGVSAVVHVPTTTDVREFVEMLRDAYGGVELTGRRNVTRPTRTRQKVVSDLLAGLTERQREVLRTAYYAGYFEWPRESTGEDLAAMLDVTQPTVSRHLRLGQGRLLAQLFEEELAAVAT